MDTAQLTVTELGCRGVTNRLDSRRQTANYVATVT